MFGTFRNTVPGVDCSEQSGTVGNNDCKAGSRLKKSDIEYVILAGSSFFSFQGGEIPTFAGHLARSHSVRFCKVFGFWALGKF